MKRAEMLDAAKTIVTKDRQADHGKPEDSFADIRGLWSAYLDRELTSADVANMMILLKIARAKTNPKHQDNWVDMAGYASCGCEIATEKSVRDVHEQVEETTVGRDTDMKFGGSTEMLSVPEPVVSLDGKLLRRCPYQERFGYDNWLRCTLTENHEGDHQIPTVPENMKCD